MVYKWYVLPIGGLYATYHLLGEPETTIDIGIAPPENERMSTLKSDDFLTVGKTKWLQPIDFQGSIRSFSVELALLNHRRCIFWGHIGIVYLG